MTAIIFIYQWSNFYCKIEVFLVQSMGLNVYTAKCAPAGLQLHVFSLVFYMTKFVVLMKVIHNSAGNAPHVRFSLNYAKQELNSSASNHKSDG